MRTIVLLVALGLASTASAQERRAPLAEGILDEPRPMATGFDFAGRFLDDEDRDERRLPRNGFYPVFSGMVTGAGWISVGSGYRHAVLNDRAMIDGSAAVSWRGYKRAQVRFDVPRLGDGRWTAGAQLQWQDLTQVQYFGRGPASVESDRSDYRLQTTDMVAFAAFRATDALTINARLGRLGRPRIGSSAGPFDRDLPDAFSTFPDEPGFTGKQPSFVHGALAAVVDTRDHAAHPRNGGMYRAAWARFADRIGGDFTFDRFDVEVVQAIPVRTDIWTLVFHGWAAGTARGTDAGVPAYLQPALGGANSLRSFADYRFHDRHLVLLSGESRWALYPRVDVAAFIDSGGVAPRLADLGLSEHSYGGGIRVHLNRATVARLDVATGREGWRLLFRMNEVFRLSRLSRMTAPVPFTP